MKHDSLEGVKRKLVHPSVRVKSVRPQAKAFSGNNRQKPAPQVAMPVKFIVSNNGNSLFVAVGEGDVH